MSNATVMTTTLPTRQPTLSDTAYLAIEERIVTLQLLPGQLLSETQLASSLGYGRTPIREALQQLAREGLVTILPRRGVVVSDINVKSQLELLSVRRALERLMARLCAERATAAERAAFVATADGMRRAASSQNDREFMRFDRDLNELVALSCRNDYARRAIALTSGLSRRFWYAHYQQVLDLPLCARLHADLAQEIATGSADDAANASEELIDYIETFTRASLDVMPHLP